jgi:hypothetical protein
MSDVICPLPDIALQRLIWTVRLIIPVHWVLFCYPAFISLIISPVSINYGFLFFPLIKVSF